MPRPEHSQTLLLECAFCLLLVSPIYSSLPDKGPSDVPPRDMKVCSGLRCREASSSIEYACGLWEGDTYLFQNDCDMAWFSCMSERAYRVVSSDYCGAAPSFSPSSSSSGPIFLPTLQSFPAFPTVPTMPSMPTLPSLPNLPTVPNVPCAWCGIFDSAKISNTPSTVSVAMNAIGSYSSVPSTNVNSIGSYAK